MSIIGQDHQHSSLKNLAMTLFRIISLSILIVNMCACTTNMNYEQPNYESGRTLYLGDSVYTEGEPWKFISWKCSDYYGGGTLVEVGRPLLPEEFQEYIKQNEIDEGEKEEFNKALNILGFILYDGSHTGDFTVYYRDGLSHRWDWGPDNASYSFIIKPDGTGLFYDFSTAENGKKSKADDVFKCSR